MAKTYAQLKAYARSRANMENSDFIDATKELFTINDAYRELYHLLVDGYEKYFITTPIEFTLSGSYSVTVDSSLYKLVRVERKNGSKWIPLNSAVFHNQGSSDYFPYSAYPTSRNDGYCLIKRELHISPEIDGTYRYWFVPDVTELAIDADEIDPECDRFWKYIALTAAMEYLDDEESDSGHLVKKLEKLKNEINNYKSNRTQESFTIANIEPDVQYHDGIYNDWVY
jgi:hypothetical protein